MITSHPSLTLGAGPPRGEALSLEACLFFQDVWGAPTGLEFSWELRNFYKVGNFISGIGEKGRLPQGA